MAVLQPRPIEELRALVGEKGADLSDEQLLRCELASLTLAEVIVEVHRDRRHPELAAAREARLRAQYDWDMAARRRRYPQERAQKARKRATVAVEDR